MNTTDYKHMTPYVKPECYIGATWYGYYDIAGRNRDSDILTNSNFDCWAAWLTELLGPADTVIGVEPEEVCREQFGDPTPADIYNWTICRENHWACGWIEIIRVHESVGADKLAKIDEQLARLDGYPVFDEQHFSDAEEDEYRRCWHYAGAREDFIRTVRYQYEMDNSTNGIPEDEDVWADLQAMLDKLDGVCTDKMIELHERMIPSGEFHHDGRPCIDLSVKAMTWDDLVDLTRDVEK